MSIHSKRQVRAIRFFPFKVSSSSGFSLVELMLAIAILTVGIVGLLASYINILTLNETSRKFNLVVNAMQAQEELLKEESLTTAVGFDNLLAYNGTTFDIAGFAASDAKGRIEVTTTAYSDLVKIRTVVSYKTKDGRIIGEDKNLNGSLDALQGEDANANGILDSPAEMVTLIVRFES